MLGRILRVYVTAVVLFLALAAGLAGWDAWTFLYSPFTVSERQVFRVEPGSSLRAISRKLVADRILLWPHHAFYLVCYGRFRGEDSRIKAGEYEVLPGMTPAQLLQNMAQGKTYQHTLAIIEGWTFRQMMKAVAADSDLQHSLSDVSPEAVMKAIGHPGEHPEGRFFPDTYLFPTNTTDVEFLRQAYQAMSRILDEEWTARMQDLPMKSPYEGLIMASIVQRETALSTERFEIAGVFVRRLKLGIRLQTDPTVIYGMGDSFDGDIRFADLRRDTPYNTYTRDGLPPTPICLPGRDAVHAALHPADGNSLYFVARGDGSHQFSATLEEHNAAVRQYQLKQAPATDQQQDAQPPGTAKQNGTR